MITLKCRNCGASLERKNGVGLVVAGTTDDICPKAASGMDDPHAPQRLLQVSVSAKVAVDADAWTLAYGTDPEDIPVDVRDYVLERMQGMITDELMVRDVAVKGA